LVIAAGEEFKSRCRSARRMVKPEDGRDESVRSYWGKKSSKARKGTRPGSGIEER